jgi:hypothetical protein
MNRKALHSISYGLYVVTSKKNEVGTGRLPTRFFRWLPSSPSGGKH